MKLRGKKLGAATILLGLLLFVCPSMAFAVTLAKQQVVKIGNGAEPKELDPAQSTGVPESHIIDNLFEGLTALHPVDLSPVPGVAESWSISNDGLTYTFKIRKDAKWSDGKKITANDFVWSWQRALSPELASEYAYQLYYIKNGEAFNKGKIKDASKLGITAKSADTLEVVLREPTPFFLRLTAFHTLYPVPQHVVTKHKGLAWTKPENIVTNGPFLLKEWKLNQHIKLAANPQYWDKDAVKIKEAWIYPIENQDTEERTFFAGNLHATNDVPVLKIPLYKREQQKNSNKYHPYREDPYLGIYYYRFNTTKKPMNDPKVRRAFMLAIDRTLIAERVTRAGEKPATNFTPPNTGGYTGPELIPTKVTPEILKEAKQLLKEAGYPDGKGFPKVEILFNTSEKHRKVALAVQQMLKKNLGVEVGLYNQEWKVYLDSQRKLNYDISRAGWIGDYPDPNTFLDLWLTDGGNNQTGWSNAKYDELIQKASQTQDEEKRFGYFKQAEEILLKELPVLPVYFYTKAKLVSENLKMITKDGKIMDYTANVQDRLFLKNLVLTE